VRVWSTHATDSADWWLAVETPHTLTPPSNPIIGSVSLNTPLTAVPHETPMTCRWTLDPAGGSNASRAFDAGLSAGGRLTQGDAAGVSRRNAAAHDYTPLRTRTFLSNAQMPMVTRSAFSRGELACELHAPPVPCLGRSGCPPSSPIWGDTRLGGVRGFTQALCQGLTCIECTKTGVCTTACTRCGSEHTLVPVLRTPPTFRVRRAGEAMQALAPVRCGLFVHISNPEVFQRTPALSLDHSRDPERRTGICQTLARTNTC
jgi:hypothetical protein